MSLFTTQQQQQQDEHYFDSGVLGDDTAMPTFMSTTATTSNTSFQQGDDFISTWFDEDDPMFTQEIATTIVDKKDDEYWMNLFEDIGAPKMDSLLIEGIKEEQEKEEVREVKETFLPTPVLEEELLDQKKNKEEEETTGIDSLGITKYKTKKRSCPLKELEIESLKDLNSIKRAKNTEAARRSRQRKFDRMKQLEDKVQELLLKNDLLEKELALLKK